MSQREVTKEEFHATVGQLDVVLRSERDATYWELRNRTLKGVTTPGYMGGLTKHYFVVDQE